MELHNLNELFNVEVESLIEKMQSMTSEQLMGLTSLPDCFYYIYIYLYVYSLI